MPTTPPGTRTILAPLALALLTGCAGEAPAVLRVGDAIGFTQERPATSRAMALLLDATARPRLEVAPWTLEGVASSTHAEQALRFSEDLTVIAAVGHNGSKGTLLAAPIYRAARLPLIVPTATARDLRTAGPGLYLLAPTDDVIGAYLVDRALDSLGGSRLAMLYVADPYGEGIAAGARERLAQRRDSLVAHAALPGLECEGDRTTMRMIVGALLRRARPDAVIIALPQWATRCAIELLVERDPRLRILTSDSFTVGDPLSLSPAARAATHTLLLWEPGPDSLSRRFVEVSRAISGVEPDPAYALTLDALLLVEAAVRDGARTRADVARWLDALGTEGHPPFVGVTGPIDFRTPRATILRLRHVADSSVIR